MYAYFLCKIIHKQIKDEKCIELRCMFLLSS